MFKISLIRNIMFHMSVSEKVHQTILYLISLPGSFSKLKHTLNLKHGRYSFTPEVILSAKSRKIKLAETNKIRKRSNYSSVQKPKCEIEVLYIQN